MAVVPSVAGTSGVNTESHYPRADLSQQEVIADKMVFTQALKRLHEELGTQYRVPQVSGRELDLFLLYKQVTHLGGLEAVITGKKWSDVSVPFQFPASFTSKSFTLRKMYSKLLFNFEQGASIPPENSLVGKPLTGHVDAKFDHGYFVSVNVDKHAFRGALYVPPAAPAPALPSSPEARRVQANESNSPADESTPEPCEVYQAGTAAAQGTRTIPAHSTQLWQQGGHTSSQQILAHLALAATGSQEQNQCLQQPAVQHASPPQEDWKVLLAEGWNNEPTPQQRQAHAHAATQQADDIGRPAERRRQQAEAQQEPDDIFRSQEGFASQQAACAHSPMPAAYPAPPRQHQPPFASHAGQEHEAADRPGLRQEALEEAVTIFPSHRHHLNQQQHPARYMAPTQQGNTSGRLDGASLQQLLQMADQQQLSTSHQLALLHPLRPNMLAHSVSGQPPVAMPRMQPPSLMPSPSPPWLMEPRPHSQLPAGQLNRAGTPVGNHLLPYTSGSSQRQSAGFLRLSQIENQEANQQCFEGS
ncbi:MAG: high mobility group family [Trebouxia sp. A1-2]|nr:MAG: high mobility group family [Trebouxia sp. A1-2]